MILQQKGNREIIEWHKTCFILGGSDVGNCPCPGTEVNFDSARLLSYFVTEDGEFGLSKVYSRSFKYRQTYSLHED